MKEFILQLITAGLFASALAAPASDKKIILIAGGPSHGPGAHEHYAGCTLLKKCLDGVPGVTSEVYRVWPENSGVLQAADSVVIYSDGQGNHPALQGNNLQLLGAAMKKGTGLVLLHYAVEPTSETGHQEFLKWIGGCFETDWSVNPFWTPNFSPLPKHPITRGVSPFSIEDEWYFHMRFVENMKGVTPILTAVPPESTMSRADDPHAGNPTVRKAVANKEPQHVAWAYIRPDGGRGFGFTGGHNHVAWGNDDFRKLVLNAILWSANAEVPQKGVDSKISSQDLKRNLDAKGGPPQ